MDQDLQHLKILSILHYVLAGLFTLLGCCPILHFVMGAVMAAGVMDGPGNQGPPRVFGILFMFIALVFMIIPWAAAVAMVIAGLRLSQQKSYTYCLVCAGIACAFMPIGTALGVFSIIVLMRPSVKALFEGTRPPQGGVTEGQ